MTPAARVAAAIDILDAVLDGAPAEQAFLTWSRRSRFAGAKDREAVRDHLFDALRRRRSAAARGGAETGRGIMLGLLRESGTDPGRVFGAGGHAPPPLTEAERAAGREPAPGAEALDVPDWILPRVRASLGAAADAALLRQRERAPVWIRAALHRIGPEALAGRLAEEGIVAEPSPLAPTALRVVSGARGLRRTSAWEAGLFEFQDAASQAVCARLPLTPGGAALDFCAGGGGKALALAARGARVLAHDALPRRMADLPARAERAGTPVRILSASDLAALAPVPLVLVDAPCSGSGTWARTPDAKWRFAPADLDRLTATQDAILDAAAAHVAPGGHLAYATCSLLAAENGDRVDRFLARAPGWREVARHAWSPLDGGDGFFLALLLRESDDGRAGRR